MARRKSRRWPSRRCAVTGRVVVIKPLGEDRAREARPERRPISVSPVWPPALHLPDVRLTIDPPDLNTPAPSSPACCSGFARRCQPPMPSSSSCCARRQPSYAEAVRQRDPPRTHSPCAGRCAPSAVGAPRPPGTLSAEWRGGVSATSRHRRSRRAVRHRAPGVTRRGDQDQRRSRTRIENGQIMDRRAR